MKEWKESPPHPRPSKMGRPTSNPKTKNLRVRISEEMNEKVTKYAEKNGLTKTETVRKALEELLK